MFANKLIKQMQRALAPVFLFLVSLLLIAPGSGGKNSPGQGDEIMHIQTVQDSYRAGTYYVPTVQGYPNYFKPPLLFWSGLLTHHFSPGLFGFRLSSVIFAAITAVLLYWLLIYSRVHFVTSFVTALAYICSVGTMKFGRLLMMEQGMACFFTAFVLLFLVHYRTGKYWPLILAGLLSGVAFLFKGPIFIVYEGMLMAVWASMRVFRFGTDPHVRDSVKSGIVWKGKKKILPVIVTGLVFLFFAALPSFGWIWSIYRRGDTGQMLLKYFFIVENFGKFGAEDQGWLRIIGGWITYALPWTPIIVAGAIIVLRKKHKTFADFAARIMLLGSICIVVLHAIPYRKAAYYSLPMMPIIFGSVATALRDYWRLEKAARVAIWIIAITSPLLALLTYFASWSLLSFLLLTPVILSTFLVRFFKSEKSAKLFSRLPKAPYMHALSAAGVTFIILIQFVLYPLANKDVMPAEKIGAFTNNICVLSSESWDAMELKNMLPDANIRVSVPGSPVTCADGVASVFYVPDLPTQEHLMENTLSAYRKSDQWEVWRRWMDARDVIRYLVGEGQIVVHAQYFVPAEVKK